MGIGGIREGGVGQNLGKEGVGNIAGGEGGSSQNRWVRTPLPTMTRVWQ